MTTIGIKRNEPEIKQYIISNLKSLNKDNLDVIYEDYVESDTLFIKCSFKEGFLSKITDKKVYEELTYSIASTLSDVILNNYESMLIKKIIRDYYIYVSDSERKLIYEFANRLIKNEENIYDGYFYKQLRRSKIVKSILNYLKTENLIILDGFVNFRLDDYIKELCVLVDKAVESYITQKEYNEFIKLLRYFVEIQESKINVIHVVAVRNSGYILMDENKSIISHEDIDEFRQELTNNELNYDDILISNLITIAPRKIILHKTNEFSSKEIIQTIQNVFYDRTEICLNCDICGFGSIKKITN